MVRNETWERLSLFESHEYVSAWYSSTHGIKLTDSRVNEINFNFSQAREYFSSSAVSASSVRPLLLYYGVLSLSRSMILLKDRSKSEGSLRPGHGLETANWRQELSEGIGKVLDLRIIAKPGTFTELAKSAGNTQWTTLWHIPPPVESQYRLEFSTPKFVNGNDEFSLKDIISRDHRFVDIYYKAIGTPALSHSGEVISDGNGVTISVYVLNGLSAEEVGRRFGWLPGQVKYQTSGIILPTPAYAVRLENKDFNKLVSLIPHAQYKGRGIATYMIEDMPNGDRLSDLFRSYMISYIIGMLARYFPSRWISCSEAERVAELNRCCSPR